MKCNVKVSLTQPHHWHTYPFSHRQPTSRPRSSYHTYVHVFVIFPSVFACVVDHRPGYQPLCGPMGGRGDISCPQSLQALGKCWLSGCQQASWYELLLCLFLCEIELSQKITRLMTFSEIFLCLILIHLWEIMLNIFHCLPTIKLCQLKALRFEEGS